MLNTIGENPHRVLKVREAASFIASTKSWLDKSRLTGAGPPFVRIGTGIGARVGRGGSANLDSALSGVSA